MSKSNDIINQEKHRLRNFGVITAIAFSIIGTVLLWNDKPAWPYLFAIASVFLIGSLAFPKLLYPIEWAWMKLAHILGYIMTRIILTITFYLIITPIGLLRQLFGKDPLGTKIDKSAESYWKPVDPQGRPYKPY